MSFKYGKDAEIDFTQSSTFRAAKRWTLEVERFSEDIGDPNITIDKSGVKDGHVTINVKDFQNSGNPLIMNIEIPHQYPMHPPFAWIESPTLTPTSSKRNLSFGMFSGVPCLQELTVSGWSPTLSLAKTFLFVYSAVNDNCMIGNNNSVTRSEALRGRSTFVSAHSSWDRVGYS